MKADLIIPTYKPGEKFRKSLRRLAQQTRKPDRLIIINTEETFSQKIFHPYMKGWRSIISKKDFDHGKREITGRLYRTRISSCL